MSDEKILTDGEKLYNLTQSDEFKLYKERYDEVMLRLADIRNIPFTLEKDGNIITLTAEERTYEMQVRQRVLLYMQEIFDRMTGDLEEYNELLSGMTQDKKQDGFLIRLDK